MCFDHSRIQVEVAARVLELGMLLAHLLVPTGKLALCVGAEGLVGFGGGNCAVVSFGVAAFHRWLCALASSPMKHGKFPTVFVVQFWRWIPFPTWAIELVTFLVDCIDRLVGDGGG